MPGPRYVNEFTFPAEFGFTGSAGQTHVRGYARGGHVERKASGGKMHLDLDKGALHRDLGVPQGQKIPAKKLAKAAHSSDPKVAKRARFAETMKSWHHKAEGGRVHSDEAQDKALIRKMVKPADLKKARGGKVRECMGGVVKKAGGGLNRSPGKKRMAAIHAAERQRVKGPAMPKAPRPPKAPEIPMGAPPMATMGGPPPGMPMGGAPGAGLKRGGRAKR